MKLRYRTLARVIAVRPNNILVNMPGWNPHKTVAISKEILPKGWLNKIDRGSRFFCRINLGAGMSGELAPSAFDKLSTSEQVRKIVEASPI